MNGLLNHFHCVCGVLGCLRFSALRRFLCAAASGLLLGGCASSIAPSGGQGAAAGDSAAVRTERGAVATPLARGDIPNAGNPAGIQLYAQTPEGIFLLVADHAFPSQRGWAGFGGAYDKGETIAETAARETEEETRGYFKRADLLAAIAGQEPIFDGKFAFYFVQVDKVPVEQINNYEIAGTDVAFVERGPYMWVPYTEVERYLEARSAPSSRTYLLSEKYLPPEEQNTQWFWPVWLNNFRAAQQQNALPWHH